MRRLLGSTKVSDPDLDRFARPIVLDSLDEFVDHPNATPYREMEFHLVKSGGLKYLLEPVAARLKHMKKEALKRMIQCSVSELLDKKEIFTQLEFQCILSVQIFDITQFNRSNVYYYCVYDKKASCFLIYDMKNTYLGNVVYLNFVIADFKTVKSESKLKRFVKDWLDHLQKPSLLYMRQTPLNLAIFKDLVELTIVNDNDIDIKVAESFKWRAILLPSPQ